MRIGIIGAGVAGLTAAWRLQKHGADVQVIEAGAHIGGRARSLAVDVEGRDAHFDLGAWTFTANSSMHRLSADAGLGERIIRIPTTVGRARKQTLHVGDLQNPLSLPLNVFSWTESLNAAGLCCLAPASSHAPKESAANWAGRHFSEPFTQNVLSPIAALYFLQPLDTLSRDDFISTLRYLQKAQLMTFQTGMGELTDFLAEQIPVRRNTRIVKILQEDGALRLSARGLQKKFATFDAIIVTAPLPETIRLLAPYVSEECAQAANSWPYASTLAARFLIRGRFPAAALQMLPPRSGYGERWYSCGLSMERAKHISRTPEGYEAVTMYANPDKMDELGCLCDEKTLNVFAEELRAWLGVRPLDIVHSGLTRWEHAAAYCDPHWPARLDVLHKGLQELSQKLPIYAAGDFLGSSGLEGAVNSAEIAAKACLERLEA